MKRRAPHVRPLPKGRPQARRVSSAAAKADAAERERIRRMSPLDRALLALDLGERLDALAKLRT